MTPMQPNSSRCPHCDRARNAPHDPARGERHGRARLTVALVKQLRARYVKGSREHGSAALAREYGLNQRTVYAAVTRLTWSEVR